MNRTWLRTPDAVRLLAALPLSLLVGAIAVAACSDSPGTNAIGNGSAGTGNPSDTSCNPGASKACSVTLGQHDGVLTCYQGTRQCLADKTWGQCTGGKYTSTQARNQLDYGPRGPGLSPAAEGTDCDNNPCDPTCQDWQNDPDVGYTSEATGPLYDWSTGSLSAFPSGLVNKGITQPCRTGQDCQFNEYCQNVSSGSTCAHHKCMTGAKLSASCDPCVQMICAKQPSCCTTTCAHEPCVTGVKLASTCNDCVAKVCANNPACCTTSWDASCVAAVATVCGGTCPSPTTWDQSCVDLVDTLCDARCGSGTPPMSTGVCTPWLPGETDPTCAGIDLAAGPACDGKIPVCNHGKTQAPAGINIVHFPANSQQYPKCAPDISKGSTCVTTEPIPPGMCIDVTGCIAKNENVREILINPVGMTGYVNECTCLDNWTMSKDTSQNSDACKPPDCSGAVSQANILGINMYIMIDRSGSMDGPKWTATRAAMEGFFSSTTAAGMNVALEFYPLGPKTSGSPKWDGCGCAVLNACQWTGNEDCNAAICANPLVPAALLTTSLRTGSGGTDTQEQLLYDAFVTAGTPLGGTPTYAAMQGGIDYLTALDPSMQKADVFVLVTDGEPNFCCPAGDCNVAIGTVAQNGFLNRGIRTYTIGMQGANITALNTIASMGGTGSAFVINGSDVAAITAQLTAAMSAIAGQAVNCDIDLPAGGKFDPVQSTVYYVSGTGTTSELPRLQAQANCGSGWYYDNNTTPTKMSLCPDTCSAIKADAKARVEIHIGCPMKYGTTKYAEKFVAACPPGQRPQWGFLAYSALTPSDSKVEFRARTAETVAELASASYTLLTTAETAQGNSECPITAGTPLCPVDLFNKLNMPAAGMPNIEIEVTTIPSWDTLYPATVNSWELTYSCPAAE